MKLRVMFAALFAVSTLPALAQAFGRETTSRVDGEIDAQSSRSSADGVYGRFDGDVDFGVGLGAAYDAALEQASPRLRLTGHYFSLAGLFAEYDEGFGRERGLQRKLALGVDVRPLFVPRWALDLQQGPAFLDLTLDSISLGLGGFFSTPAGQSFGDERGFTASLGFGLPLAAYASGPWLEFRGGLLWPDDGETRAEVLAALTWHFVVLTPLSPDED